MTRQEMKIQLIASFIAGNRWDISTPGGKLIIYREVDAILERILGPEVRQEIHLEPIMQRPITSEEAERWATEQLRGMEFDSNPLTDEVNIRYHNIENLMNRSVSPEEEARRQDLRETQQTWESLAEAQQRAEIRDVQEANLAGHVRNFRDALTNAGWQEGDAIRPPTRRERRGRGLATPIILEEEDGTEVSINSDAVRNDEEEEDSEPLDTTTDDRQDEPVMQYGTPGPVFLDFANGTIGAAPMPPLDDAAFIDAMMRDAGALPENNPTASTEPEAIITPVALRF